MEPRKQLCIFLRRIARLDGEEALHTLVLGRGSPFLAEKLVYQV